MPDFNRKAHWENIYQSKSLEDMSWYQPRPETSLLFFSEFKILKSSKIIDIGGGDSLLVDHLLRLGYEDVTVLDISSSAIDKAKKRLGDDAAKVKWIVCDVAKFQPTEVYDFWHDRAAFHFLTTKIEIDQYIKNANFGMNQDSTMVVGTFSENGPKKCSGIEIKSYSETELINQFSKYYKKLKCINLDHVTPFGTSQNFNFCSFRKKE
jgi:cyclopropane fatty-acyl-phospholipid synthase-like methyltransferase